MNRPSKDSVSTHTELALLAKAPIAGQVKTRLMTVLSAEQACAVHCQLIEKMCASLCNNQVIPWRLWVSEPHPYFEKVVRSYGAQLELQHGKDLGERLFFALNSVLTRSQQCLLIGSDCPSITASYLQSATDALANPDCDMVIGPATDGGYVLLGLKQPVQKIFEGIDWGSSSVFSQTCKAAKQAGLHISVLPTLSDIDRPEDLKKITQSEGALDSAEENGHPESIIF